MHTIENAAIWIINLTDSSIITGIAVIAVATVGFGMLSGRLQSAKAFRVVLGCFVLVNCGALAGMIVEGFSTNLAIESQARDLILPVETSQELRGMERSPSRQPVYRGNPFDPYTGDQGFE